MTEPRVKTLEKRAVFYYRLFIIFTWIGEVLSLPAQLFWNIGSTFKRRAERTTYKMYAVIKGDTYD